MVHPSHLSRVDCVLVYRIMMIGSFAYHEKKRPKIACIMHDPVRVLPKLKYRIHLVTRHHPMESRFKLLI